MNLQRMISALLILTVVVGCAVVVKDYEELYGPSSTKNRIMNVEEMKSGKLVSYKQDVQPILNQRCIVCHACYDAPCQLNMTSFEGVDRGATKAPVYNGARFLSQEPTRLGFDATTTAQWRDKGFHPVLNERRENEQINLDNSLLYQMLALKRRYPLPTQGRLPAEYDVGTRLDVEEGFVHSQQCPSVETFPEFAAKNPQWGMPFALPGISREEFKTIEAWLEQGARVEPADPVPEALQQHVDKWELFLNGSTNKEKLMARYIYEHLFLGHLYFSDLPDREFFMLVRSRTPPGEPIDIIATVRPYDSPGAGPFYYRLKYYDRTIVEKTHLPYALNDKRMLRYEELFLTPDYEVKGLPSFDPVSASNPFKTYAVIPPKSRYQFLLDEAQFFVGGFIKGPVCRGSIALSVIDDHFWVMFMDPDKTYLSGDGEFLARVSDNLRMPSEQEDKAKLWSVWRTYSGAARNYLVEKVKYLNERYPGELRYNIEQIWDGDGTNQNAALTVYRHYDSATVLKGFVGEVPKTGWIMDYPIFERIHYLLVAGFNVYGTAGHQLSTRLYMDYLRIESELQFLAFLPYEKRFEIHKHWYRGTKETEKIIKAAHELQSKREADIKYETDDVKTELFIKANHHMRDAQPIVDYINLCGKYASRCDEVGLEEKASRVQKELRKLSDIEGEKTDVFPDTAFLRIIIDGNLENDVVYTIVRNKSYLNNTFLMVNEKTRIKSEDTIDIVEGFVGAYPNFFFEIRFEELDKFIEMYAAIDSYDKYNALVETFGIRRTNPGFWKTSDWFYEKFKHDFPRWAGVFDLNRYQNR
ncbi:fatty acid cis/trans isomerase [Kaarinaea lacus]